MLDAAAATRGDDGDVVTMTTRTRPGLVVIHVAGELDIAGAALLRAATTGPAPERVRVQLDLTEVTFLSVGGLQVLAAVQHHRGRRSGGRFTVVAASRTVRRLLDVTGLTDWITSHPPEPAP